MHTVRFLFLFIIVTATSHTVCYGQGSIQHIIHPTLKKDSKNLLTDSAFSLLFHDNFSYALLGSQAPATGVKFETVKPSITLSGNIYNPKHKRFIINLELTGGATDGFMDLYSKDELNGLFKVNVGINWLSSKNSGWIERKRDTLLMTGQPDYTRMNLELQIKDYESKYYKAAIYKTVLDEELILNPSWDNFKTLYKNNTNVKVLSDSAVKELDSAVNVILSTYTGTKMKIADATIKEYSKLWHSGTSSNTAWLGKVVNLKDEYAKQMKIYNAADTAITKLELKTYKNLFTKLSIWWFTLSPNFSNTTFRLFNSIDSSLVQDHSSLYGLKLSFNNYRKSNIYKSQFLYISGGIELKKVNSLEELDKFSYKKTTEIKANKNESLSDEKTGTAYSGKYKSGAGIDLFVEGFTVPWKQAFIPGFYAKIQYTHSEIWINKDKIALDLGLLYNLTSSKETKSVLSIVPYVKWSNILREKDLKDNSVVTPLHDLFSVGLRVGIPINLSI